MSANKSGGALQVNIVKLSAWRVPRQFITGWMAALTKELKKQAKCSLSQMEITVVFVEAAKMKELNRDFRGKDKVTDILSFSGFTEDELGELVLCGKVVDQQATQHGITRREELGYLLIHGVLHLLGYEHEKGRAAAQEMFELQDQLFEKLRARDF